MSKIRPPASASLEMGVEKRAGRIQGRFIRNADYQEAEAPSAGNDVLAAASAAEGTTTTV